MNNPIIIFSQAKAMNVLLNYENIVVAVSGGADSDIIVDIISKIKLLSYQSVRYVWFDTSLEYDATKKHLDFLEEKYGIKIERIRAKKTVPIATREFGQPFLNKYVSEMIKRLQKHNFKWQEKDFDALYEEYPDCKIALKWWCNDNIVSKKGNKSSFNISNNKWLKEFIIQNPPNFKISNKCCTYAKKNPMHEFVKENQIDLVVTGIRKAEGGSRKMAYKSCWNNIGKNNHSYMPILFYKDNDKEEYEMEYQILHSDCYTKYGLKRTGCAGCPFGRNFEFELSVVEKYEPMLAKAIKNIFKDSYEYTRMYNEFKKFKETR